MVYRTRVFEERLHWYKTMFDAMVRCMTVRNVAPMTLPPSPIPGLRTVELTIEHAALLQRFFDRNPAYFLATSGAPAGAGEAEEEITEPLPADMSYTKKWVIGYVDETDELAAMRSAFTERWKRGRAMPEAPGCGLASSWATSAQSDAGFPKATAPVRQRHDVHMGVRTVTIQVMYKPLRGGSRDEYLELVPRDREE